MEHRASNVYTHSFSPQNLSNTAGLLKKLNAWFPGEFKAVDDPPLYRRQDTIVVKATRKVSAVLDCVTNIRARCLMFAPPFCRPLAKWSLK